MKRGLLHLRTLTRETLLVALVGLIAVATVVATLAYAEPLGGLALDLAVLASVIVGVKHTRVGQVLTLVTLAALVVAPLGWGGMAQFASVLPVLGEDADLRRPSWIAYSAILVGLLTWDGYRKAGPGAIVPSITFWSVLLAITWLVSYAMRASTLLHEAERERALTAQRQALARDLHDTVAHSLSVDPAGHYRARRRGPSSRGEVGCNFRDEHVQEGCRKQHERQRAARSPPPAEQMQARCAH